MPTVEQIWRALPGKTSIAAGKSGIYNEVSWVVTLKPTPPAFDRLRGKEFALVEMNTASSLGITLPYLVTSLAAQGVSGLGVAGEIVPSAIQIANEQKIPLFKLPAECDIKTFETQLTALIRDEREHLYQLEQDLTRELMKLTLAGTGAKSVLEKIKESTGRNCLLLDLDYKPGYSNGTGNPPDLQAVLSQTFPSPPASITGLTINESLSAFISPITGKHGNEGYLLVTAPAETLKEADRVIAKVGALSLAIEISRQQAVEDVEDKFQTEMLDSLLSGDMPAAAVKERAERLGLDLNQYYTVILVKTSDPALNGPLMVKKAGSVLKKALCYYRNDGLVILYPTTDNPSADDLRRLGHDTARQLTAYLGAKITLGMGRAYSGAAGLRTSLTEAERALAIGVKLFGEGSSSFFGDLGIYRLLLGIGPDELTSFYKDSIGRLAEYEKLRDGELLATLEAILKYPTLAETAKALHIHRNTLLYRLQRIQEIANVNLDDGETRLILHVALRAGEVLRVH